METFEIKQLSFAYPNHATKALCDVTLSIEQGQFITLCGKSGCGKTTLLQQLKPSFAPHGTQSGEIRFEGEPLKSLDLRTQSEKIGFVLQSPENQIVTDKVWHELAFGLESLGYSTAEIRARVAEMASFFGIQTWFHQKVTELSGGQKQILNLAAIMAMQPSVLILDEPTSQLDPIAASEFLATLGKINRELGTTILLTEHRLEDVFPMSHRVIVMDAGRVIADGAPREVGAHLKEQAHDMFLAMPTPMRIFAAVLNDLDCPLTVRDGRQWLADYAKGHTLIPLGTERTEAPKGRVAVELSELWFQYDRARPDVIKGLSASVNEGELYAIVGGNGTGKTTSLSIMTGLLKPYRGAVKLFGKPLAEITEAERFHGLLGVLPQNPQSLFVKKTVELDLLEMFSDRKTPKDEQHRRVAAVTRLCELNGLLHRHPYDLSGGEQQRAALAKVLLLTPRILLLDEPTKGLDAHFKEKLAGIFKALKNAGVTIVMVSHDIEFCASYADRCALFFDGAIVSEDTPRRFFAGKSFYTTSANRMARTILPDAVLTEDVIRACGGTVPPKPEQPSINADDITFGGGEEIDASVLKGNPRAKRTPARIALACVCAALFAATCLLRSKLTGWQDYLAQFALLLEVGAAQMALFPGKRLDMPSERLPPKGQRKLSKRTIVALAMIIVAIPLTIYIGIFYMGDRKYYLISLLIMLETLLPFALVFESRKPQPRELVIIAVLCAIAVAGRAAFFMVPQFKPVLAIVMIAGVCFGGETGFLVGAMTAFVSNFFFGQGPWTPWQMFSCGIIGFLAGVLFRKGFLQKKRSALCLFGGLTTFAIYGGLMDTANVLMYQANPTWPMFLSSYSLGISFNLLHAAGTVIFLWFISGPMIEKLERIKLKYGLVE